MGAVQRIESVDIRVRNIEEALEFYTDVMGLVGHDADGETTYLGCGMDPNYDLAVRAGDPGIDRFAVRVTAEEFDRHVADLEAAGVDVRDHRGRGYEAGVAFELPASGVTACLVVVEDTRYHHAGETSGFLPSTAPVDTDRAAVAPLDLDHVAIESPDVEADARFLERVAGFRLSDAQLDGDAWQSAFVRYGVHHHDLSVFAGEGPNHLNHVAWATNDVGHMKLFANALAQHDVPLTKPFTKHGPGANVAFYFTEPGGTRFEYNTDMATVAPDAPEGLYDRADRKGDKSVWGGH